MGTTGRKTALVGAGVLGALVVVGGVAFAVLSTRAPARLDEPQRAASRPAALSASEAIATAPPAPAETSTAVPEVSAAPIDSKQAAAKPTIGTATLATAAATPSRPSKAPKMTPPPSGAATIPGAAPAAPAPSCTVATDYDSDGQPHFKKVCR
jgi:hypothetical protein